MFGKTVFRSFRSYTVLKPFVDFETLLSNLDGIKANVRRRKLDVNVDEISAFYENLKALEKVKNDLEESREVVREKLTKRVNDENEERKLKMTAKLLREDHKQVKSAVLDLEENLAGLMMKVPNELSPKTTDEDVTVWEKVMSSCVGRSHIDVGSALDVIEEKSPWAVFLKDDAAMLELEITQKLQSEFIKRGFVGFSNPDFVREIVTYGCGVSDCIPLTPFEPTDVTYLTGGAAPEPFYAFFAKNSFKRTDLPVRCAAVGRSYGTGTGFGLFAPRQTTAVQIFLATNPPANEQLDDVVALLTDFYDKLDIPFRVVRKSASHLKSAESLRFNFEVFSPHYDKHFEVGHVSLFGDHLSKNMNIQVAGDKKEFAHIISGTVLRFGPVLAGILETKGDLKSNVSELYKTCTLSVNK